MFFPKLRRQAKWVFVLLVVVFGASFVLYGVGTGQGGLEDLLRFNIGGGGGPSISELQERISKNPADANAYRELSRAYVRDNRQDEAVDPLKRFTELRPKNRDAFIELGGLYINRAQRYGEELNAIQNEALSLPSTSFGLDPGGFLAKERAKDPISRVLIEELNQRRSTAFSAYQAAGQGAVEAYKKAVDLSANTPELPSLLIRLGQTAEAISDIPTALSAYRRFLKVSPDSPDAPLIRERIKALRQATQPPPAPQD